MNPYTLVILFTALGLGTTITFMSSHWLLAWMGLEMNTLAIIPLMAQHHHPRSTEAATKYFITQAAAAAMLLFAAITNAWLTGQWDVAQTMHPLPNSLLILALALKLGLAPTHVWLPEVLQGLDLTTGMILSTWQKLAPFTLLLQIHTSNPHLLMALGLTSILVGGWGGLNQTQLRKILAYSSIAHLGWMVMIMQFSPSMALMALVTYIMMTSSMFMLFNFTKSTTANALATSWTKAPVITSLAPLALLSLGGLPPLTGFMPKWLIIHELTKQQLALTATMAALAALLSLYFYLRLTYSMAMTISPNNTTANSPWRLYVKSTTMPLSLTMITALMLLPTAPTIVALTLT
uniref:NADH-ubiquinone oxidoreductase chain 2 n=1 Tax=Eurypegasus draconis TaxID=215339 RepID=A7E1C8_9TELE|nr:NADH dehydrogenase subunit 2 [Eurypegasus draconis]BAF74939.1 NADH dehydrogenase subunit 2 [Eurypegasus draconis]